MSIATSLTQIATNLTTILNACKAVIKAYSSANITTLDEMSTALSNIPDNIGVYSSGTQNFYYDGMRTATIGRSIRQYACAYNYRIGTVTLPHADEIYDHAFYNSRNITEVWAPECTIVEQYAFAVANKSQAHLERITLGDVGDIGSIDTTAFDKQSKINFVDFSNCTNVLPYDDYFSAVTDKSQITVLVPHGQLEDWVDEGWEEDGIVLQEASE